MGDELIGFVPYDPDTGRYFINATGSSVAEAGINLSCIDLDEDVIAGLEFRRVALVPSPSGDANE